MKNIEKNAITALFEANNVYLGQSVKGLSLKSGGGTTNGKIVKFMLSWEANVYN